MAFNRGGQAAEQAAKDAQKSFSRISYFKLDEGDSITVRLLDDSLDWIWTKQHSFISTKDAPKGHKGKWPTTMGATCRRDECIGAEDCYICDNVLKPNGKRENPSLRLWARAVVRKEVKGTQAMVEEGLIPSNKVGRVVGHMDEEEDVEETDREGNATGKTVRQKRMILINMGMKNFFSGLQAYYDVNGTVLDRDFRITRKGQGLESEYRSIACDPYPDHDLSTDEELRAKYEAFAAKQGLSVDDVEKSILEKGSEEFYAKFFDPDAKVPARDSDSSASEDESDEDEVEQDSSRPSEDKLSAIRDRIRNGGKKN